MPVHPGAGKPAPAALLVDPTKLERAYYEERPDPSQPLEQVSFGTSGHRGSPFRRTFNETHILAITQAICDYRREQGINGPLFLGKDTHAVSEAAHRTAIEVLAAQGVQTVIQEKGGFTPTPVISHAILEHNRLGQGGIADGIVITPSHNPPADGGFKYNPPHGGPADTDVTGWIQDRANFLLREGNATVRRIPYERALKAECVHAVDLCLPYLRDLTSVIDLEAIRAAGLRIGVDPLGGAAVGYWEPLAEISGIQLTVVNQAVDPAFSFMPLDHDGEIRMDCSSPYAMAALVRLKDQFDIAFGNDPDADRHGIVTKSSGLLNPNHYLAAAIDYLLHTRTGWSPGSAVGKTLVSSSLIDRVVAFHRRPLYETPVGFKWFARGLLDGALCFGGEESAGASFLRRDGRAWATDKDGLILGLLAAEMTARCNRDPGELYRRLTAQFGESSYIRLDASATREQKNKLKNLHPARIHLGQLAGDPVQTILTHAPGNQAAIGGVKVVTANGWFAARPSGTEDIYKLYAESFLGPNHLNQIVAEAQDLLARCLA
ncbi:MAG: phosphoglucomutase (alpha-D-glucose-1,6-bisphosphate-dependent) [Bryobacteraceae bacterium]|nr:phosphoglucomutase (alpha-D-glucose-1,6-bisphosphate-dependent) [Bryobacteraceae bacterium]MDW8376603.1 phosphoglucomutase (alpha-D-glucose-1,6-bisphosphate-dependent) [Bryobacterales bacterium]